MARIEESVEIKCPLDKVFAYTTDAKSWPEWQSVILEAEQTSPGPWRIGNTFKGISRMMGLSMKWTAKVTEYEPNRKWSKNIISGPTIIEEHVTYDSIGERIRFTIVYYMKSSGFLNLFSPMMTRSMRKETQRSLRTLKSKLEAQT